MYKIHKDGWSAASLSQIGDFAQLLLGDVGFIHHEAKGNRLLFEDFGTGLSCEYSLTDNGIVTAHERVMGNRFTIWALEAGLLGKTQLEWVKRDDYSQRSDHYYAFAPTNEDGSAGFVLQAAYTYAWKGKPEVFQIAIYAVAHDKPVDISKNCIGPCLLHEVLDGMTYLDQPAPMIEAEQALRQILRGGLNQLQFTV